jgi:hypothetical protein
MHKRKRDSLAKLRCQSICKAVKDFCPRRLTSRPNAPFLSPNSQAIEDIMIDSSSFKVASLVNEPPKMLIRVRCRTDLIPQGKKEDRNRTFSEKLVEEISLHDRNDFYFSRSQYQSIVKSIEKNLS